MPLWRTPRTRALLIVGTVSVLVGLVTLAGRLYTDLLWYREVGQQHAYWTTLAWKVLAPATAGLGTACFVLGNLSIAERRARGSEGAGQPALARLWRHRRILFPAIAIGSGFLVVKTLPEDAWRLLLLWAHGGDFGTDDPIFHRDAGFFVFSLPLYGLVVNWLLTTIAMAGAAAQGAYVLAGAPRRGRGHALLLAALLLAVLAWRVRLDQFELVLPHDDGLISGASHSELAVRLPALRILTALLLLAAVVSAGAALRMVRLVPLAAIAALAAAVAAGTSGVQDLVERFQVAPQRLSQERPQLEAGLAASSRAFALDGVDVRPQPGDGRLSASTAAQDRATLAEVPVWDSAVLRPAMAELQSIGAYYAFPSTTVDRYTIDGAPQLMTVAARQLDLAPLRPESRTWANARFAYTHGYGAVAVAASRTDEDRYPKFAQGEFGSSRNPLRLTEPRIYFGQRTRDQASYVVLNSTRGEIEQPEPGSRAPEYHYDGPGGIPLSGLLRRAAFAARFGDIKLLLTHSVTSRSRILVRRDVRSRVQTLAPFLRWEASPQTVVAGGRVHFLLWGYTTSSHYPYAARVATGGQDVNYMRAPALADVDAFSGRVTLYAAPGDPILRAWQEAYPGLFTPMAKLPRSLGEHLRYPRALFDAQTAVYATHHADDVTSFWNGADAWQVSRQLAGPVEDAGEVQFPETRETLDPDERGGAHVAHDPSRARPSYLLARLPGDRRERFMLTTTYTPRGRQNLVGYLGGSVDPDGEPDLTLLSLRRDRLTIGPTQATREVLASPAVNRRIQLLNRESRDLGRNSVNRTVLGATRTVPVGDTLLHVQPLYITSGGNGLPRLQLVTAYANGRVGYGPDLDAAVASLLRRPD